MFSIALISFAVLHQTMPSIIISMCLNSFKQENFFTTGHTDCVEAMVSLFSKIVWDCFDQCTHPDVTCMVIYW